ncbi:MAG: T9SS type A sorting domain-containing protein [Saprospiraceae bacterium]|nr:T9SS type A sorting domain-containing protein [Saprospiraceae bacterium]
MKTIALTPVFCLFYILSYAQTTHNISMGSSYSNGQFYNLNTDITTSFQHSNWDIAFSVHGTTDAGIFINEGASYSGTPPKLYLIPNKTFNDNITNNDLGDELKNAEIDWSNGAFNSIKVSTNPFDYGWGAYNMTNHSISGTALFAIELSSGSYKKIIVDSLINGTYYFQYADFDNSNLQQKTISKSNFTNQTLAYFSFATNNTVNIEPATGWDWLLTRYETLIDYNGTPTPYNVGGIITNKDVEVVMADNINPATVDPANYTTSNDNLTLIGHDWKDYSFGAGWIVDTDRVYFVKTTDNTLYKIQFIDFQGSSTGTGTFQKTNLGTVSPIIELNNVSPIASYNVFPNPANNILNLTFELKDYTSKIEIKISDILGRTHINQEITGKNGLNGIEININDLIPGNYILTFQSNDFIISKKINKI